MRDGSDMSKPEDRFGASAELGVRLRRLRRAAGLNQAQLAKAVGRGWDQALVSRLESGDYQNPGLALVGDYLRACRASFEEILDILNEYTSRPTPAEIKARKAVAKVIEQLPAEIGTQALKYDVKTTVARRAEGKPPLPSKERVKRVVNLAAAASRRKRLDILVKYLEEEVGHGLVLTERQFLYRLARKFWGVLTSTRGRDPYVRLRKMAHAIGYGIAENVLSREDVRLVRDRVVELFEKMEATGAFGAILPAKPYHRPTAIDRENRGVTPEMLNRHVSVIMGVSAASAAVETRDRPVSERLSWNTWLESLVSDAHDTLPGTPEREQVLAAALEKCQDKDLGSKFADLALAGLDRYLRRK
jgi:transcriptional regulator with XRE-family HTH domain